jgi:hypothetical protein
MDKQVLKQKPLTDATEVLQTLVSQLKKGMSLKERMDQYDTLLNKLKEKFPY